MGVYQMVPNLRVLADLFYIVFIIRRHRYFNFMLAKRFRHRFLQH